MYRKDVPDESKIAVLVCWARFMCVRKKSNNLWARLQHFVSDIIRYNKPLHVFHKIREANCRGHDLHGNTDWLEQNWNPPLTTE
jgi:hypothetical protein